jgi:hypothetical protein
MTRIEGLRELQAELKKASPEIAKKLQQVNKQLVQNIAEKAKGRAYHKVGDVSALLVRDGPARTNRKSGKGSISRSVASIRGTASGLESRVVAGGPKAPGFFGHEFGGRARARTRQFPQHKGREGYFLYPVVRSEREKAFELWNDLFDEVMGTREGPL